MTQKNEEKTIMTLQQIQELLDQAQQSDTAVSISIHAANAQKAVAITKALGGTFYKGSSSGTYWLERREGNLQVTIFVPSMCERHQVGTETIAEVPAQPAREVPVYEYTCKELHSGD